MTGTEIFPWAGIFLLIIMWFV